MFLIFLLLLQYEIPHCHRMLDGGSAIVSFPSSKHGLYVYAGFDAFLDVLARTIGDEVFLTASKTGMDTQIHCWSYVSVPLFFSIGVFIADVLPYLDDEL